MIRVLKEIPSNTTEMFLDHESLKSRFTGYINDRIKYFSFPSYYDCKVDSMEAKEISEHMGKGAEEMYYVPDTEIYIFQTKKELMRWLSE